MKIKPFFTITFIALLVVTTANASADQNFKPSDSSNLNA